MPEPDGFDALVDALWRAWSTLGVHSWHRDAVAAPIDPEALIVATVLVGDLRLQRETIDWGILHAHLLSAARLRMLARAAGISDDAERWISTVGQHATQVRWRGSDSGLEGYDPSRASRPFEDVASAEDAASAVLRTRALTGPTMRADALRALHPVALGLAAPMSTAEIAARAASSAPGVLVALRDLEAAGYVRQLGTTKRRAYEPRADHPVTRATWSLWRSMPYAPWHEALLALPSALQLRRAGRPVDGTLDLERIAASMQDWNSTRSRLAIFDSRAPHRAPSGPSGDVATVVATVADRALLAVAHRITAGDRPA